MSVMKFAFLLLIFLPTLSSPVAAQTEPAAAAPRAQSKLKLQAPPMPAFTAQEPGLPAGVAIEGYSPVSYFERNLPEKGSSEFQANYNGKTYYLASAAQLAEFQADPKKYAPVFGEYCPYSLSLGRRVAIDPTNFQIADGQLLLFHRSAELDALKEWNKAPNQDDLLKRARGFYTQIR